MLAGNLLEQVRLGRAATHRGRDDARTGALDAGHVGQLGAACRRLGSAPEVGELSTMAAQDPFGAIGVSFGSATSKSHGAPELQFVPGVSVWGTVQTL